MLSCATSPAQRWHAAGIYQSAVALDHIQSLINFGIFALDGAVDMLHSCGRDKFEINKHCHRFLGEACGVNGVTTRPGTVVEILTHHHLFVLVWFFGFKKKKSASNNSAGLSGR